MMTSACTFSLFASAALLSTAPVVELRGVITRVDMARQELELQGRGAARGTVTSFVLEKSTEVLFGRQAGTLDDLPVGRRVRIEFETRDGKAVARVIHVTGTKPAPRTTPGPVKGGDNTIVGTLRRVAVTDREVVIVGPGAKGAETETTIRVPEAAKLFRGDKAVSLSDLKEGEPARVKIERRDGKFEAIEIQSGSGTPTTADPAKEQSSLLPKLRIALQLADQVLKMLEDRP
jgi:hypothetical protein